MDSAKAVVPDAFAAQNPMQVEGSVQYLSLGTLWTGWFEGFCCPLDIIGCHFCPMGARRRESKIPNDPARRRGRPMMQP